MGSNHTGTTAGGTTQVIRSIHDFEDHSRGAVYDDFSWVLVLPTCINLKGEATSQAEAEQAIRDAHHRYEVAMGTATEGQST